LLIEGPKLGVNNAELFLCSEMTGPSNGGVRRGSASPHFEAGNSKDQLTPLGAKFSAPVPLSTWGTIRSINSCPNPRRCGGCTVGAAFLPVHPNALACRNRGPLDRYRALRHGQRAVLRRIGRKLMQHEPEILHRVRLKHHVGSGCADTALAFPERLHLHCDQFGELNALPVPLQQQIV